MGFNFLDKVHYGTLPQMTVVSNNALCKDIGGDFRHLNKLQHTESEDYVKLQESDVHDRPKLTKVPAQKH